MNTFSLIMGRVSIELVNCSLSCVCRHWLRGEMDSQRCWGWEEFVFVFFFLVSVELGHQADKIAAIVTLEILWVLFSQVT